MASERMAARPISLALRLTLSIGAIIALVFLALGWLIERSLDHHFAMQDAEELEVVARSIQQVLTTLPDPASRDEVTHRLSDAVKGHHGMYYQVKDAGGRTLFASPGPDLNRLAAAPAHGVGIGAHQLRTWQEGGQSYRGTRVTFAPSEGAQQTYTAAVAAGTGFHDHFLAGFRHTIWAATSVAGLFAILATWLAVYRGHAPLRQISARIRGISANQLDVRLDPAKVPIELSELVASFNVTLERIEQDFTRLSNFSADIAHELRTPITNLVTQTQVLLTKGRSVEAYREVLYSNLEEYERMAKMIGDMLYLAQTDNHLIKPDLASLDLSSEVDALFEYFEPWADERHVSLTRVGSLPPVPGDRLMLRRALSNLLSNAVRHTPADQTVTVTLLTDAAGAMVQVANPGPTIAPEHLPHLFDRFYRIDPSRQRNGDGAGLGLAIVKSIAEAHGGSIGVRSEQGVTTFELRLPAGG
ncbi:MAG: heavy metal sensor histidine kinase [Acidobacteriota bacterium]